MIFQVELTINEAINYVQVAAFGQIANIRNERARVEQTLKERS
jgi:hypothetical protein